MEFDARIKEPDKVQWSCKVVMPDGETVELKFRDFAKIPGRITLDNLRDDTSQLWSSLAWGLIEPKNWPVDNPELSPLNLFRTLPMDIVVKIHRQWQKEAGVSMGESEDSKDSSENTETNSKQTSSTKATG